MAKKEHAVDESPSETALITAGHVGAECGCVEDGCLSPKDPPWIAGPSCSSWFERRCLRTQLGKDGGDTTFVPPNEPAIEFRITYEHRLCLVGKQHGPLLYTVTLLPGEKVTLFHSERYRSISSVQSRFSVQTTFMQFVSAIQQTKAGRSSSVLHDALQTKNSSVSGGGGASLDLLFFSVEGGGGGSEQSFSSSHQRLSVEETVESFAQTVAQASSLTHSERSLVISTFQEKDSLDVSSRVLHNPNECHPVTYFVRGIHERYALSTRVAEVSYRIIARGFPDDWRLVDDVGWLHEEVKARIEHWRRLLPKRGVLHEATRQFTIPTDGAVYDPELSTCCACDPERKASIRNRIEKEQAEARKLALEAALLELEVERRKALLASSVLDPFEPVPAAPTDAR